MSSSPSPGDQSGHEKNEDHISNLPDTILCYILSFHTTMSAVRTSILSKRWKYVWTKVPALDFSEVFSNSSHRVLSSDQKICFQSFMNKVLLHNDTSYVQRLCLNIYYLDRFFVNSWLTAAPGREMHELDIVLDQNLDVCLPPRFLLIEKLVVLKLEGSISFSASMSFHLPNLETIHLSRLKLPVDECMKKLSTSCPVLRELHIVTCRVKSTPLCVESLTLKSLSIRGTTCSKERVPSCIVIKTPNLAYLCLQEYQVSLEIGDMDSLIEADCGFSVIAVDQIKELITKVSGVKTLHLKSPLKDISESIELPAFSNLTWLECMADKLLSKQLHCAPKLKSLSLLFITSSSDSLFDLESAPEHLPCLETVVIGSFSGKVKELELVAYFLKAASGLKEMKINLNYSATCDITTAVSVCQELLDIPGSSAVCRVKIATLCL